MIFSSAPLYVQHFRQWDYNQKCLAGKTQINYKRSKSSPYLFVCLWKNWWCRFWPLGVLSRPILFLKSQLNVSKKSIALPWWAIVSKWTKKYLLNIFLSHQKLCYCNTAKMLITCVWLFQHNSNWLILCQRIVFLLHFIAFDMREWVASSLINQSHDKVACQ